MVRGVEVTAGDDEATVICEDRFGLLKALAEVDRVALVGAFSASHIMEWVAVMF